MWNQPGPAGAAGPQGAAGDRGPDGAPSSLQGRIVTAGSKAMPAASNTIVDAKCRSGEHVLTGGYVVDSGGDPSEYQTFSNTPEPDGSGWHVQVIGYYSGYRLLVFAVCAPQPGGAR